MKNKYLIAAVMALSLAACSPATVSENGDGSSNSSIDLETSSVPAAMDDASSAPADTADSDIRIIDVTVTDWEFPPATITAAQGEKVQLRLKGDKGIQGLLVDSLGLNVRIEPGTDTVINLPTDVAGTFEGRCNVPCGPGHRDVKFTIVVE